MLAREIGVEHIEVSAKTGNRIQAAFTDLTNTIYTRMKPILSRKGFDEKETL